MSEDNNKDIKKEFGDSYTASSLGGELGLKGVRQSPSQYLGSRSVEGAIQAWLEIVQNSVDESAELLAFMKKNNVDLSTLKEFEINIKIHKDDTVEIADTGRGVPADHSDKFNRPVVEAAFEEINVGGKGRGYVEDGQSAYLGDTIGQHGSGAACANATSDFFTVDTYVMKDNKHYRVEWEQAEKVKPTKYIGSAEGVHGTIVKFRPSKDIFELYSEKDGEVTRFYKYQDLLDILTEYAYNTDNIKFVFSFEDEAGNWQETVIRSEDHKQEERLAPYVKEEVYSATIFDADLGYRMKIFIGLASSRNHFLTCNMLRLKNGTHLAAVGEELADIKKEVVANINQELKAKKVKKEINERELDDLNVGSPITYTSMYLSLFMDDPNYSGQSKDELRVPRIKTPMRRKIKELLNTELIGFKEALIKEMTRISMIYIERQDVYDKEKERRKQQAEKRKREKDILSNNDPTYIKGMGKEERNLTRARNQNLGEVVLYMVEGETAKSAMIAARDVNSESIYPIIRRPPNVFIHNDTFLWGMERFRELYKVLYGDKNGNYKAVVIATDNDADGKLIKSLLLGFISKFFPRYLTQGRVFDFRAPKFLAKKGDEKVFLYSLEERRDHYTETGGGWTYFSYKGLGSIPTVDLVDILNAPTTLAQFDKKTIAEGVKDLYRFLTDKHYKKDYVLKNYGSPELYMHESSRREILKYQEVEYDVNELDTQYTYEPDFSDVRRTTLAEQIVGGKPYHEITMNDYDSDEDEIKVDELDLDDDTVIDADNLTDDE